MEDSIQTAIQLIKDFALATKNPEDRTRILQELNKIEDGLSQGQRLQYAVGLWAEAHKCDVQTMKDRIDDVFDYKELTQADITQLITGAKRTIALQTIDNAITKRATEILCTRDPASMSPAQRAKLAELATIRANRPPASRIN